LVSRQVKDAVDNDLRAQLLQARADANNPNVPRRQDLTQLVAALRPVGR